MCEIDEAEMETTFLGGGANASDGDGGCYDKDVYGLYAIMEMSWAKRCYLVPYIPNAKFREPEPFWLVTFFKLKKVHFILS